MAVTALSVVSPSVAQATHMDSTSVTASTSEAGATSSYTFEWMHGAGNGLAPAGSRLELTFPAGFDVSGASLGAGSTIGGSAFTADVSVAGQVVLVDDLSVDVVDGIAFDVVIDGVVNPTVVGPRSITVGVFFPGSAPGDFAHLSSYGSFPTSIHSGELASLELTDTSGAALGAQIAGQAFHVRIRARDAYGNLLDGTGGGPSVSSVDLTSSTGGSAGLGPTAALSGGELFHSVTLTEATDAATLTATGGAVSGSSTAFPVAPAAAHHLTVVQAPADAHPGEVLAPSPVVEVRDEFENVVGSATGPVRVELVGSGGAVLSGTLEVPAVLGVATFDDLRVAGTGADLTLRFAYVPGGLVASDVVDSTPFRVAVPAVDPPTPSAPPTVGPTPPAAPTPAPEATPEATPGPIAGPSALATTGATQVPFLVLLASVLLLAGMLVVGLLGMIGLRRAPWLRTGPELP